MQYAFLSIFALVWSIMTLAIDGSTARNSFQQYQSCHYAVTTGKITRSEVKSHSGRKGGTTYEAVINYSFKLGGQTYAGQRLRYNKGMQTGSSSASDIVAEHPMGAMVPVYYNPENPQDSLLFPGIDGSDFFLLLFLTPFNAVMLGFWIWIGGWLRQRLFRPAAGGVKIIASGMRTRVRLPQYRAAAWGLATTGGLGFISVFIVGFSSKTQPSLGFVLTAIGIVYLTGVGVYLWHWQKIHSGIDDLVINQAARTLDLPQTYGRKQLLTVNIADIKSLTVEKLVHRNSKGGTSYTYAPTLHVRGHNPGDQKLADWSGQVRANDFTDWLRKQLGS